MRDKTADLSSSTIVQFVMPWCKAAVHSASPSSLIFFFHIEVIFFQVIDINIADARH